jgi:hypothetical protein
MNLADAFVTAGLTTGLGLIAFVLGQLGLKLFVDPIQEQARTVGGVTHALTYYRHVSSSPTDPSPEDIAEARRAYRDLAATLRMTLRVLPKYWFFARLQLVLPEESVRRAAASLIVLSTTVQKGSVAEDVQRHSRVVRESLGIEQ